MRDDHSIRDWFLIFLLAAAFPIVVHVALVELVIVTAAPLANAVRASGLATEREAFIGVMRVLNGLLLGILLAIAFGIPLGFLISRQRWLRYAGFVIGVLVASAIWYLLHESGIDEFVHEWRIPEMWLSVLAICGVAALTARLRSRARTA